MTSLTRKQITLLVVAVLAIGLLASSVALVPLDVANGALTWSVWLVGWLQNLGTEAVGALATFGLIELALGRVREREAEAGLKARLIREMGSDVRDVAIPAVEELRARGWLEDGSHQPFPFGLYHRWPSQRNSRAAPKPRALLQTRHTRPSSAA